MAAKPEVLGREARLYQGISNRLQPKALPYVGVAKVLIEKASFTYTYLELQEKQGLLSVVLNAGCRTSNLQNPLGSASDELCADRREPILSLQPAYVQISFSKAESFKDCFQHAPAHLKQVL